MSVFSWIVLFTLLGGIISALTAGLFVIWPATVRARLLPHMVSFATGTLLGAAFVGLLPRALDAAGPGAYQGIGLAVLGGILLFFSLEKLVLWRHCHHDSCEVHAHDRAGHRESSGVLILLGDGLHNFLDGVLIAAAFLTDINVGVVTSLAVFAHEVPQEVGDLAILLNAGMSRGRAMFLNLLVSLTAVAGALVAYFWLEGTQGVVPYVLAVAAASFIYVAVADLIPGLHRRFDLATSASQLVLIAAGIVLIFVVTEIAHTLTG